MDASRLEWRATLDVTLEVQTVEPTNSDYVQVCA